MKQLRTIRELVHESASKYGEQIAYRFIKGKEVAEKTFRDLKQDTEAFGNGLKKLGAKGLHVGIIGPTSYEYIVAYIGTMAAGSVAMPLDRELPKENICHLINQGDITVLVYDEKHKDLIPQVKVSCTEVKYYISMSELIKEEELPLEMETIESETLACILFTSGTTGVSKGVMLSHKNLMHNVTSLDMKLGIGRVLLSVLPIHHAYCFSCDILVGLYFGATVCINDSMMHLVLNLKRFAPDIMLVVPMIAQSIYYQLTEASKAKPEVPKPLLAKVALGGKLELIYCGGAYLNPKLIEGFREFGIELLQGYGMTESAPRISCNVQGGVKEESVGKLLPGVVAKVVKGEIWVKSDSVMQGYYKQPEMTKETLEDGWLKTGDLGYVDEEQYVYITGRKKNLIILSNGENISAEELENKLYENPLISEVLVYGENNVIIAEVYPHQEYMEKAKITECEPILQKVIDQMNENVPLYKRIHKLRVRSVAFEKTTSKKIKRRYSLE